MQYMLLIKAFNILPRYHIDLCIPLMVQFFKRIELLYLPGSKIRKIFQQNVHWGKSSCSGLNHEDAKAQSFAKEVSREGAKYGADFYLSLFAPLRYIT